MNGKTEIVQSLKTRDLSQAQKARWPLVADWSTKFEVLLGKREWSPEEIEEKALQEFNDTLRVLHEHGQDEDANSVLIDQERDKIEEGKLNDLEYALSWARIAAANGRNAALAGRAFEVPRTFGRRAIDPLTLKPVNANKKGRGITFAEAARRYVVETQRDPAAKIMEQTRGQYEASFRLFDQWANEPTLSSVTREEASNFLDIISTLNPNWGRSPETKRRTFSEIFELYGDHETGLGNRTLNRYAIGLSHVWQWAEKRGKFKGENPWTRQHRRVGESRKSRKLPFTEQEIAILLRDKPLSFAHMHSHACTLAWVSLIAAYSGMRLNEICERKCSDIRQEDGVWYFDVQHAKSEAGDRKVPLHSRLIAAGLLDLRNGRDGGYLFPALKPGGPDNKRSWYLSKKFTEHRRRLGVTRLEPETGKERIDFHSFRRAVIKILENERLPQSEVAQVVGHEREGITFGTYNPEGLNIRALRDVVEAIRYRRIDCSDPA
jgi:integrase